MKGSRGVSLSSMAVGERQRGRGSRERENGGGMEGGGEAAREWGRKGETLNPPEVREVV